LVEEAAPVGVDQTDHRDGGKETPQEEVTMTTSRSRFWRLVQALAVALGVCLFAMAIAGDHARWTDVLLLVVVLELFLLFAWGWPRWVRQVRWQPREEGRREAEREK
jgi:hypothetical protein